VHLRQRAHKQRVKSFFSTDASLSKNTAIRSEEANVLQGTNVVHPYYTCFLLILVILRTMARRKDTAWLHMCALYELEVVDRGVNLRHVDVLE
jgi:hypothetical protein